MKRIRLISIVVGVILLGGLGFAIFRAREPRYQGRTLSEWIEDDMYGHGSSPEHEAAERAVKQIGTNAVPWLLKWAEKRDSSMKRKVIVFLNEHPAIHLHLKSDSEYNSIAYIGFASLGTKAKPVWPMLIQWTFSSDMNRQLVALDCLEASKPDKATFLPVLLRMFHDSVRMLRNGQHTIFTSIIQKTRKRQAFTSCFLD